MKKKSILGMMLIFLITGCSSSTSSPTISLPPSPTAPIATETISTALVPTATLSPSPSVTNTNIPDSAPTDTCFEMADDEIPLSDVATGVVVLSKGLYGELSLFDLQTGIKYEVTTQSKDGFTFRWDVSPDRNLLAITEELQNNSRQFEKTILWIFNSRADVLKKITFNIPGLYDVHWLDNENIIFHTEQSSKDGTVILFNPFTRAQRNVSNDMPDFYTENYFFPNLGWLIEYSPDMEWGVYFGITTDRQLGYVIRDFTNKKTIWQVRDFSGEYQRPEWSPKGNDVAVVKSGNLYLINRDGRAKPILDENQPSQISQVSWSPNGRYMAFWNFNALMFYDGESGQAYDTCLKSDELFPLYWSPDGHQFAIPAYLDNPSTLVDIQEKKIYKLSAIPNILYPQGWMNSIP